MERFKLVITAVHPALIDWGSGDSR